MRTSVPLLCRLGTSAVLLVVLSACVTHLVEVRDGSDAVAVLDAKEVTNCQFLGNIAVSVLSEVGIFTRSADAVEADLLQLARNGAVQAQGDTVVKGNSMEFGKRSYGMYKCRP